MPTLAPVQSDETTHWQIMQERLGRLAQPDSKDAEFVPYRTWAKRRADVDRFIGEAEQFGIEPRPELVPVPVESRFATPLLSRDTLTTEQLLDQKFDAEKSYGEAYKVLRSALAPLHSDKASLDRAVKDYILVSQLPYPVVNSMQVQRYTSGQRQTSSFGEYISSQWNNGWRTIQIADSGYAEMMGYVTSDQGDNDRMWYESNMNSNLPGSTIADWIGASANLLPMILDTAATGIKGGAALGAAGAVAGAAGAVIAGQAGPQVALPEEVVTVPSAALAGFAVGFTPGFLLASGGRAGQIEAGLAYHEIRNMRDPLGNRVPVSIARGMAGIVGLINGGLEVLQLGKLVKTVPGLRKLLPGVLRKAGTKTTRWLAKRRVLQTVLGKGVAQFGSYLGGEIAIEVMQESSTIILGEFAKQLSNELAQTDMSVTNMRVVRQRIMDTITQSAKGFTVLGAPGTTVRVVGEAVRSIETAPKIKEGVHPAVTRISTLTADEIQPRVDISEMGTGDVAIPAPVRKSVPRLRRIAKGFGVDVSDIKGKGTADRITARIKDVQGPPKPTKVVSDPTPLTPKEADAFRAAETADLPSVIKPLLYIGNVTQRMKRVFGEALGVDPNRILGYMDDGWTVKRTAIPLSRTEAYDYLLHLETSLNDRLDNNQIRTHNDMARANADWGDVKELRSKLGLPVIKRPFTIIRDQQTQVITIENLRERITKAVQPSKAVKVVSTQIDQLNVLMRKVAKATEKGYKLGKVEQKKIYAELQYLQRQIKHRKNLILDIAREPTRNIDPFYRAAIDSLRQSIDLKADTEAIQKTKQALRERISADPDMAQEIPPEILELSEKKDVGSLSIGELETILAEVKRLRKLGALKSKLAHSVRERLREAMLVDAQESVAKASAGITPSLVQSLGYTPARIYDMFDGGQNFEGELHDFFVNVTNKNEDAKQHNEELRYKRMQSRQKDLSITIGDLSKTRRIGDVELTVEQTIGIYAGWKNPAKQLALRHHGIEYMEGQELKGLLITDEIHQQAVDSLSEAEQLLGDTIIQDYADTWSRVRYADILANNHDPLHEVNYTPISRLNVDHKNANEELTAEFSERDHYRTLGMQKGFVLERKDIDPKYQLPVRVDIMAEWAEHVQKQEHFINHAPHIKDMRSILNNKEFREAVQKKFGEHIYSAAKNHLQTITNPQHYRTFSGLEHFARMARQHSVIAYLAFNLTTYAKQVPSILLYWNHSSIGDMFASTLNFITNPNQAYHNALNIHPQLADKAIEREMQELREANVGQYRKVIQTVGRAGLFGIAMIDRMVKTIGVDAIYTKFIRDGLSPKAAAQKAANITLREQPGFNPKDRAAVYSQSEYLNLFLQFTNQLNKLFNIAFYDMPSAFKQGRYRDAVRTAIALGIMAQLIRMITTGEPPEDPIDAAAAIGEQALASVPIIGPVAASAMKGYRPGAIPPLKAVGGVVEVGKAVAAGKPAEDVLTKLIEPVGVILGLPVQAPKQLLKLVKE